MLYVGSSTVSIGTTTQSAMLTIAGSSTDTTGGLRVTNSSGTVTLNVRNDGAVFIGTNTSTLNSALICRLGHIGKFRDELLLDFYRWVQSAQMQASMVQQRCASLLIYLQMVR